jgi:hypothetical protein
MAAKISAPELKRRKSIMATRGRGKNRGRHRRMQVRRLASKPSFSTGKRGRDCLRGRLVVIGVALAWRQDDCFGHAGPGSRMWHRRRSSERRRHRRAGFICRDNLLLDRYCASNGLLFAAGGRKRRAARKIADGIRLNNDRLEPAHDPRRGLHRGPRATARGNIIS